MNNFKIKGQEHARMSVPHHTKPSLVKDKDQTVVNFPYCNYPFPNQQVCSQTFNTIVQCSLNKQKISKILSLNSENLISLKKIVKLKNKNKNSQTNSIQYKSSRHGPPTYSFHYQKVQFSLGYAFQSKFIQRPEWLKKKSLSRLEIKKTLANFVALLYKEGIILFLEFQQIGINHKGVIKVYVAPNVLFDDFKYNPKAKVLVIKSMNEVLKIIDAKYPKFEKSKNPKQQFKLNDVSIEQDILQMQQSIIIGNPIKNHNKNSLDKIKSKNSSKEILQNQEKSFNEEEDRFFVASGSTNLDNLKMNNEIKKKFEKHKFQKKVEENLKKQKKSRILIQMQQKLKIDKLTAEISEIRKKLHQNSDQNAQKYPYAQKAFNTMVTQDTKNNFNINEVNSKLNKQNKKRKTSLSSINFFNGPVPQQKNINCVNIYQSKCNNQQSYYIPGDDIISVDTYELQIENDYRMPKIHVSMGMRNSLNPKKQEDVSHNGLRFEQKQHKTQNMRIHGSAGGKNYGYIVNLLKPQFEPKRSNIYEEPQMENQQESKKSTSLKKSNRHQSLSKLSLEGIKRETIIAQRNLVKQKDQIKKEKKTFQVFNQYQEDLKNLFGQNRVSFSPYQSHRPSFEKRATLPLPRYHQKNPQVSSVFLKNLEQKPKKKEKLSQMFIKTSVLQQKVREAMQRTKKAINILNQTKLRQNSMPNQNLN